MPALTSEIEQNKTSGARQKPLGEPALVSGVLAITAMLYAASIRFEFTYDDRRLILDNPFVQAWRFLPQYFRGQVWQHLFPAAPGGYYRPLSLLWFRINHAIFGLNPVGWHVFAIAVHLVATFLAYRIARKLTGRPLVAALTALLFGIHPMRHEVVASVSGATESLCAVFFLCAFLAYLNSREHHRVGWMSVSCVSYAAGLLSGETAIVLPCAVIGHAWLFGIQSTDNFPEVFQAAKSRFAAAAKSAAIYVPVVMGYLIVRFTVLHGFSNSGGTLTIAGFVLTLPSVLFFYLRQWFLPVRLAAFYDVAVSSQAGFTHFWLPVTVLAFAGFALWYFRDALGRRETLFASAWLFLTLLPALDLFVFSAGELVHDRYFYLPGFGASLLIALAAIHLTKGPLTFGLPRPLLLAVIIVLGPLSYSAANAQVYWSDDFELFQHAALTAPRNPAAMNNYALQLDRRGGTAVAISILKQVLQADPRDWQATYNLGRLSYNRGDLVTAEQYFRKTKAIYPTLADVPLQLALIEMRKSEYDQAERDIRQAIELRPTDPTFHFALGVVLARRNDCLAARDEFQQTLALKPAFPKAAEQMQKCQISP